MVYAVRTQSLEIHHALVQRVKSHLLCFKFVEADWIFRTNHELYFLNSTNQEEPMVEVESLY